MGDTQVQKPTQTQTPVPPVATSQSASTVPNDQAASTADVERRRKAAGSLSKAWLTALGGLVPADAGGPNPKVELHGGDPIQLQQAAYGATLADGNGATVALDYLSAAKAEDKFSSAVRQAKDAAKTDAITFGDLRAAIQALISAAQDINGPGLSILAKLALVTDNGKEFLRSHDHGPSPAPIAKPLADFISAKLGGTDAATVASRTAYQDLLKALQSPTAGGKAPSDGSMAPLSEPELKKAEGLITSIKGVFSGTAPLSAKADATAVAKQKVTPQQMKQLQDMIGAVSNQIRDWVYSWRETEGPNKGKGVLELFGSYMSPSQVEEMNSIVDPVERLYKDLHDKRNGKRDPKAPEVTEYQLMHTFLASFPGEGGAPTRKRLQSDARIMEPYLYFQSAEKTKILIRMIVTGREEPDAVDRVQEACDRKDSLGACGAIFQLAGQDPKKLDQLRTDLIFIHRLKDQCRERVKYNGIETTAYELFLRICGINPNETQEKGSVAKETESNPDPNAKPLEAADLAHIEETLYTKYAKPIADQLNSWYTRDAAVMESLRAFQKAAAEPQMVLLLRRGKIAPGPALASRIQAMGCDVRAKCAKGLSDQNLHEAERILGFVADQATTGVIGGEGALATDNKPKSATKVGLEQALRETNVSGGVLTQVIHDHAKELADELGRWLGARKTVVSGIWKKYSGIVNDKVCADLRDATGLPRVWAIELLANAFLPIGGGALESKLKSELGKEGNDTIAEMGMSPTDIAGRRIVAEKKVVLANTAEGQAGNDKALADATGDAKAADAAESFRSPAKAVFDGFASMSKSAAPDALQGLGNKLKAGLQLHSGPVPQGASVGPKPAPAADHDKSAVPGGPVHPGQGTPTDFTSFYKKEYGIDPQRHAVEVAKALATQERTAKQIGDMFGVTDASLYDPPKATNENEVKVDASNITLVSPGFSAKDANERAQKIWDIIHGANQGAVQLIRQQFGSTEEEDRLINVAFRKLSAGIDMHFFLQQHLSQQKAWDAKGGGGLDRAGVQVGGGGVGDADKRGVHVVGLSAETEAAAERAATGKISIEKQLTTLITSNNMDEVYRILDGATESDRRAILANGELMTKLRGFGDDSYEWNRIYKTLTGQADLYDRLESRAHGKHGVLGSMFSNTDEKGMADDIKAHAKRRKGEIRLDVIAKVFGGVEPTDKVNRDKIDKEVNRQLKIEFQADLENPSIRALLADELSGVELANVEGQLTNSGEENKTASVLAEGDLTENEEKMLEDIKKMSPADRKKARENPEYITQLRKSIQSQATWRDAMILLESNEDGSKGENADNYAKLERASRSQRQDTTELMFEQDEVIEALSKLSPDEYARLKANPRLMAQVLTSLEGHPAELAKARQMMAFNADDAAASTGLTIGDKADPAKNVYTKSVVERIAFLKFSAENQVTVGASRGWGVLLQAAEAVYNMKLKPSEIEKANDEEAQAGKSEGGGSEKPLTAADVKQSSAGGGGGDGGGQKQVTTIAKVGAPVVPASTAKPSEEKPVDPKASEDALEAATRQKILDATKAALDLAIANWGPQKSETSSHERTEIAATAQQKIISDAILRKADPANTLLMASTGDFFNDDEDRIKETLRTASDDKLIREWSNCVQLAPNTSKPMKAKYEEWKTTRAEAGRAVEAEPKPEPGAAAESGAPGKAQPAKKPKRPYAVGSPEWIARTAFKTHVLDTSSVFEDLLLKYTGGMFADDKKTEPGEKRVRDNSEWLEWRSLIRDRLPNLDREKIGTEIGCGGDKEAMDLLRDPNAKALSDTLGQLDYDSERYLVDRGAASNYNMDRATAEGEGLALDNSMDDYRKTVMTSVISKGDNAAEDYGNIDAGEAARIADAKARFQSNDAAFREAKAAVANIAATVVALIVTAVVTILTAGTATGPLVTILLAAGTAAAASTGANATKKAIQGTDFEFGKEGLQAIARDTIMGAITAGTTWYAGKLVNGMFAAGSAAEQAAILARTAADPGFFLQMGKAMAENSLQTGMQGMFESGMAAFDPAMWLDGWNEGWRRGSHAARERASEIPMEMLRAAVIAAMSHSANAGLKAMTGGGAPPPGGPPQHASLGNRMDLGERTSHVLGQMGHGGREGVIMGASELILDEKTYRPEGQKPGEMLGHVAQSSASMAQMSAAGGHQADAQALIEAQMKDPATASRAKAAQRELEQHGAQLTPHEQKIYAELATNHGGIGTAVLSVAEFKQARGEMVEKALAQFAAEHEKPLSSEDRAKFEAHVNAAESLPEYIARADGGPQKVPGIKLPPPVKPDFAKPAELEKVRNRAKDVLEKLTTATEGLGGKLSGVSEALPAQAKAVGEAKRMLDEMHGSAKSPTDHAEIQALASRLNVTSAELGRAIETVSGAHTMDTLTKALKQALDAAAADPQNAMLHKALHELVVTGYVASATSPAEVSHAATVIPKKLAELQAMIAEISAARDNAARRALSGGETEGANTTKPEVKEPAKETKATDKEDPSKKEADAKKVEPGNEEAKKKDEPKKDEPKKDDPKKDDPKTDKDVTDLKADPNAADKAKFNEQAKIEAKERLTKDRPFTEAEQRQFDHMFKEHGMPDAERLMKEWLQLAKTEMPPIDKQMDEKQKKEDRHPGIEVHNHITGVAEPQAFLDQINAANGSKPKEGDLKWLPLLEALKKLDHGNHIEKDGKIEGRGVSGDAMNIVRDALQTVKDGLANLEKLPVELRDAERTRLDKIAKDAVDKAMKSSDDTDFNSAYELRDELIKGYYGKAERDAMMKELGPAGSAPEFNAEKAAKYREHFQGRDVVLEAITKAEKAQRDLSGETKENPLDPERKAQARKEVKAVGEQIAYDQFMMDTIEALAKDGIRYSEQSVSANKMDTRFDPQQFAWVKAKLEAKLLAAGNKELAQRVRDCDIKYIAMMNTSSFGGHDPNVDRSDLNTAPKGEKPGNDKEKGASRFSNENVTAEEFNEQVNVIARQALRPDSVGTDIAGMEHVVFDKLGQARFRQLYDRLLFEAKNNKKQLVLRPHVGEGAIDVTSGDPFGTKGNRQVKNGELTTAQRAEANVKALIKVCQDIADANGGKLPPEVVIRFGHATHATPEMAADMARLGIIAEINLTSNEKTGAESPTTHPLTDGDLKKGDPNISLKEHPLDEHSLASFVFNGAQIILSTDGHSVMNTGLGQEYAQAKGVIQDIINNKYPVFITAEQARAEIKAGGKVAEPAEGQAVVPIKYEQMSPERKKKFDDAYQKLFEDARKYFDSRPKSLEGVPPPDDSGPKKAAEQKDALSAADAEAEARKQGKTGDELKKSSVSDDQRTVLQNELKRQVPDVDLMTAVENGTANSVVSLVFPGSSGDFGIKRMNDESVGLQINSGMIKQRDALVAEVFRKYGLEIVDQNYKSTTVVSSKSPAELAADLKSAMAEIDKGMGPIVKAALEQGHKYWTAEVEKLRQKPEFEKDETYQNAQKRVKKIEELQGKVSTAKDEFKFDMHLGVAPVEGKTYGDALAAEMNASKAAIMSRDPKLQRQGAQVGDGRANVFDENHFVQFCKDTVGMRKELLAKTIKFHGVDTPVMTEQGINRDILRDLRKGKINREQLSPAEQATFDQLELYFTRINALDYFKSFTGPETGEQGQRVAEAKELMKQLKAGEPMSEEMASKLRELLAGDRPQSGTASEAAFFNKAEAQGKRVVLNADIKDMGLDLFEGYESKMDDVAKGKSTRDASQTAADKIVQAKRTSEAQFRKFYENYLLKKALAEAKSKGRQDLVDALMLEKEPMILLGGDEITVSLHPAFEELGLLNLAIRKLSNPDGANARVSVTHTDPHLGGRMGHLHAMGDSQQGHDLLKGFEKKARELRTAAAGMTGAEQKATIALAEKVERLSTTDKGGATLLVDAEGREYIPGEIDAEINAALKKPADDAKKSTDDEQPKAEKDNDLDELN